MSIFAKATPAPKAKTKNIRAISLVFAGVLAAMAVAQLFTFEKFGDVLTGIGLPGGADFAQVWGAIIVTLEVMSLPFLLAMRLSPAMRVASMTAGWLSVIFWLVISLWENVTSDIIASSGLLGATVSLPVGWWSVLFCAGLGVLAAWASWGMWPWKAKKK